MSKEKWFNIHNQANHSKSFVIIRKAEADMLRIVPRKHAKGSNGSFCPVLLAVVMWHTPQIGKK